MFYVTDLTSKQVTSPQRQKAIKARLMDVLAAPGIVAGPTPAAIRMQSGGPRY